jgi:hypothetical protein
MGCTKLQSIPGLGQLRKLRYLTVNGCDEIAGLYGVEHLMVLRRLEVWDCPKLQWDGEALEQLRGRLKEGLHVQNDDGTGEDSSNCGDE